MKWAEGKRCEETSVKTCDALFFGDLDSLIVFKLGYSSVEWGAGFDIPAGIILRHYIDIRVL